MVEDEEGKWYCSGGKEEIIKGHEKGCQSKCNYNQVETTQGWFLDPAPIYISQANNEGNYSKKDIMINCSVGSNEQTEHQTKGRNTSCNSGESMTVSNEYTEKNRNNCWNNKGQYCSTSAVLGDEFYLAFFLHLIDNGRK